MEKLYFSGEGWESQMCSNIICRAIKKKSWRKITRGCLLPPANEVCEGYVFTGACLSTQGACLVAQGSCVVAAGGECVDAPRGGMRGCSGCMHGCSGGHAWLLRGRGCAWLLLGGACVGYNEIRR